MFKIDELIDSTTRSLSDGFSEPVIEAIEKWASTIEVNQSNAPIFGNLSQAYLNLEKFKLAEQNARKALEADPTNLRWWYKLIMSHGATTADIKLLQNEINSQDEGARSGDFLLRTTIDKIKEVLKISSLDYRWYQTSHSIVITVPIRNPSKKKCTVNFETNATSQGGSKILLHIQSMEPTSIQEFELTLFERVNEDEVDIKIFTTKVEFHFKKVDPSIHWTNLEYKSQKNTRVKNWDKIADELDNELKEQGFGDDEGVNEFFKKIYENGTPEVRKAMMKSFQESAGTVLSTDWADVSAKKTPIKTPDGLEFKKWDH
ncbi:hypothetical protein ACOME3_001321 [Neoechinorhynchus agilis]